METEEVVQITPLVKRITAGNSSVFTGPGTNTYIVGNREDLTRWASAQDRDEIRRFDRSFR